MAHDKPAGHRVPGHPAGKIRLSMDELNASLDSFLVGEPAVPMQGRVVARSDTGDLDCTNGATCNVKCGPTAYWECGPTSLDSGCDTYVGTCYSCGYGCPTWYPDC